MNEPCLSPQRELFAQQIAKCGNQSEAYRVAYPKARNWTQNAVAVKASRLMATANVGLRVLELREQTEKACAISRAELVAEVAAIAHAKDTRTADRLRAYDLLCKILGYYAAEKYDVRGECVAKVKLTPEEKDARIREVFGIS